MAWAATYRIGIGSEHLSLAGPTNQAGDDSQNGDKLQKGHDRRIRRAKKNPPVTRCHNSNSFYMHRHSKAHRSICWLLHPVLSAVFAFLM